MQATDRETLAAMLEDALQYRLGDDVGIGTDPATLDADQAGDLEAAREYVALVERLGA